MEMDKGYVVGANVASSAVAVAGVWSGDGHMHHKDNRGAVAAVDKAGACQYMPDTGRHVQRLPLAAVLLAGHHLCLSLAHQA